MVGLVKVFHPLMIFVTYCVAFVGSYACIVLGEQYRLCNKHNRPKILRSPVILLLMTLSLGGVGIWAMHFIGMSGVKFYTDDTEHKAVAMRYRNDLTIGSFFAVTIVCGIGLFIAARERSFITDNHDVVEDFISETKKKSIAEIRKIDTKTKVIFKSLTTNIAPLLASGVTVAGGVCAMHYLGMKSMVFPGHLSFNAGIVTASVIIAVTASIAALWILFRFLAIYPELESLRIASGLVMALAVNGMHYTGMAAGQFIYDPTEGTNDYDTLSVDGAVLLGLIWTVTFIWIVFMAILADLRAWYNHQTFVLREIDLRANYYKNLESNEAFMQDYFMIRETESDHHISSIQEKSKVIARNYSSGVHRSGSNRSGHCLLSSTGSCHGQLTKGHSHPQLLDMNAMDKKPIVEELDATESSTAKSLFALIKSKSKLWSSKAKIVQEPPPDLV
jgi:NO-binding membrane sensor protein with MHYT domain